MTAELGGLKSSEVPSRHSIFREMRSAFKLLQLHSTFDEIIGDQRRVSLPSSFATFGAVNVSAHCFSEKLVELIRSPAAHPQFVMPGDESALYRKCQHVFPVWNYESKWRSKNV